MKHRYRIGHLFCGIGGSAMGTSAAAARVGEHEAEFECVGGIDSDPLACADFRKLTGAPALCADLHELTVDELRAAWGPVAPDVVMSSPPCKGFSGLLSAAQAQEEHYQKMNRLMVRALMLLTSTWDQPPAMIFFENVPRIESRGQAIIAQCRAVLEAAGYVVATGNHNCGELGNLAQNRQRWFLLARHRTRVDQFVYCPPSMRVRACGEVIGPMPMPGDVAAAGPMHAVPNLAWKNWCRLALIPAGGDWRDLAGVLAEGQARRELFRRLPVTAWEDPAETVVGPGGSSSTNISDPRVGPALALADNPNRHWNKYAVAAWDGPAPTVIGATRPGSGAPSIADPRPLPLLAGLRNDDLGVLGFDEPARAITGQSRPRNGRFSVADPRFADGKKKNWQQVSGVTPWGSPCPTVTSGANIHAGAFSVNDPRVAEVDGLAFTCKMRSGAYRVMPLDVAFATITGSARIDNTPACVADDRIPAPPALEPGTEPWLRPERPPGFTPIIIAEDGTWHRPLTTLELAVLQSLPAAIDGEPLVLAGTSHTRWREAIGNMVPPAAAAAIGSQLLRALLATKLGRFMLASEDIWVAPFEQDGEAVPC